MEPEVLRFRWSVYGPTTVVQTDHGEVGIAFLSKDDEPDRAKGVAVALVKAIAAPVMPRNGPVDLPLICDHVGRGELKDADYWSGLAVTGIAISVARHVRNPRRPMHISHRLEEITEGIVGEHALMLDYGGPELPY